MKWDGSGKPEVVQADAPTPDRLRRPQIGFLGVNRQPNLLEVGQQAAADWRPDEVLHPRSGVLVDLASRKPLYAN